jgi:hypothetical protein
MGTLNRSPRGQLRGQPASAHILDDVVQETFGANIISATVRPNTSWSGSGAG